MLKRILFFILTNIAVVAMISIIFAVLNWVFGINLGGDNIISLIILSLVIGFSGAFISLGLSRWSAKRLYNITLITEKNLYEFWQKEQKIYNLIQSLSSQNSIMMPEVGIYEDADINAFATGRSKNASLVGVSSALLEQCNDDEIAGIIAHEMTHILNGDMVTMTLLQWVLNTFIVFLSHIIARIVDEATDGKLGWIWRQVVYILLQVLLGIWATLIAMKFSRYREYRADLWSAQLVGKSKMIAALRRLQKNHPSIVPTSNTQLSAFKISTWEKINMFSSHPSLESRIQALEENYQLA